MAVLGGTQCHTNQFTASNTAAPILTPDPQRIYWSITNTHATVGGFISGDSALTATNGHEVLPVSHIECSGLAAVTGMYLIDTGATHPTFTVLEVTVT
jgi:hypothetical protein